MKKKDDSVFSYGMSSLMEAAALFAIDAGCTDRKDFVSTISKSAAIAWKKVVPEEAA